MGIELLGNGGAKISLNYSISPMRNTFSISFFVLLCQLVSFGKGPDTYSLPYFGFGATEAQAENLAGLSAAGLNISLESKGSGFRILIKPKGGIESLSRDLTANVFAVENPSRLVVDIPGFVARGPQKQELSHSEIGALRLGVHKDKTRLVLDIKSNQVPEYNVASDANLGALVVSFGFDSSAGVVAKTDDVSIIPDSPGSDPSVPDSPGPAFEPIQNEPPEEVAALPIQEPSAPEEPEVTPRKPEPRESQEEDPNAFELPLEPTEPAVAPIETAAVEDVQTPAVSGFGVVNGVYYQAAKNSKTSSIMVDVDGLNQYSLSQAAPGAYELLLRDTSLKGPHLSLPQFPPDTFKGFEVIVASQQGKDVVVKVYTDSGVKLSPFIAQGKLWLRVTP